LNILSVDTSGGACSVAVFHDECLAAEEYINNGMNHSTVLMDTIDQVFHVSGMAVGQMDLFAVSAGPGSFTGLRIGMSTIKAFAQVGKKPIAAINTLDLLAANFEGFPDIVCPMIDARQGRVYACAYKLGKKIRNDSIYMAEELAASFSEEQANQPILLLGDGADIYEKYFKDRFFDLQVAPGFLRYQRASAAMRLALAAYHKGKVFSCFDARLNYFAQSQAERSLRG